MPEPHPRERPRAYHNDSLPNSNTSYPLLQHNPQEQGPYRRDNFHIVEPSPTSQMSSSEHSFHQEFFTPEAYRNDSSGISHIGGRYLPAPSNFDEPQHGNEYMPGRSATVSSEGENEKAPNRKRSRIRGWALELIGLLATLAAFISLLVVLKTVDNQPLSTWHFPFSVNTVVSTLSVVVKTPLAFVVGSCLGQGKWSWFTKRSGPLSGFVTFDDASRGPLGCAALLWWLKSRYAFSRG
ncbi:putative pyridoxamine 5 -phosphate oxidase [Rosellinia necatrix]|uniref:Putative pyridoxamine 5-phosphate oxidase n=1 Tax=Rosellinia necatrix TaxID=77044 RepID=A0A1S8A5B0_ROSNE|nr:putative pyridoxamine 5 -phosphate oxidase [Rosellinia necatrix]